jgi:hypothetical protein
MSDFSIRDILTKVQDGIIRIPTFQRGFVWDSDTVAFFMDSIYKSYPFGTIQLWRTKEKLTTEKALGPFPIFQRDDQYPIDYVLDGQQRITSIFGVFQTEYVLPDNAENPFKIYFDLRADVNIQDSQFVSLADNEVDNTRHFPLNCLFDTVKYRQSTNSLPEVDIKTIDELQAIFKEVKIPFQTLETDDSAKVAIVFERINRKGIPLDTFQLLSAWTWSEDFVLQSKFEELTDELRPYGFEEVGGNINLLLRICSAILADSGSASAIINLNGATVRDRFDEIINGIRGAIDFLKTNFKIEKLNNLPYDNLLVPLSVFFSVSGNQHLRYDNNQREVITKWFWRTCFSKRYSAGILRALNRDIEEIKKLKNKLSSNLSVISINVDGSYFLKNQFTMGTVNTKTFILMLAQNNPKSFITGSPISLSNVLKEYNRNEFHHIYPRAYLKTKSGLTNSDSSLANFCFMSRSDNQRLGGMAPSIYRQYMEKNSQDILNTSYIDETKLFKDDYDQFILDRTEKLLTAVGKLIN